jgi:predicted GNAT family acetyltransferase
MICEQYPTADSFLQAVKPFLLEREMENTLIAGLAESIANGNYPSAPDHYYASVSDDSAVRLAALMTPPFNLIIAAHKLDEDALLTLAQHVKELPNPIPGVLAKKEIAQAFCNVWNSLTNATSFLKIAQRGFQLTSVVSPVVAKGNLRKAILSDADLIAGWIRGFGIDAGIANEFPDPKAAGVDRIEKEMLYLWEVDGTPVSMAATSRPTERSITINLVYTPDAFRGKGYASNCVAALSQMQLDIGFAYCTLFTDLSNPTSNSIYQKIGYTPIADFDLYRFEYPSK